LWSFGVVLYELATGVRPFDGPTTASVFAAILEKQPIRIRERNPELSADLERIIGGLLEKNLDVRYQTAADVRADLRRVVRDRVPSLTPEHAPSLAAVGQANTRRWLWLVSGIASLLLLATVLLALLYLRQQPAVPQVVSFEIPLPENVA